MIKIKREEETTFVNAAVTDFTDALGYCEYKILFSLQGIKPPPSQSLILGTRAHHEEEKYEQEHVELEPVSVEAIENKEENIEFAREDVYSILRVPFEFPSEKKKVVVSLSGRIDKIARVNETLIVQDDKFVAKPQTYDQKSQPYPNQLLQVLTYLNSLYSDKRSSDPNDYFEMPHTHKKWQIRICDRNTRKPCKVFSELQDDISLHYLHTSLEKFASIALDISKPEHHNSKPKCDACNLKSSCEFKI